MKNLDNIKESTKTEIQTQMENKTEKNINYANK